MRARTTIGVGALCTLLMAGCGSGRPGPDATASGASEASDTSTAPPSAPPSVEATTTTEEGPCPYLEKDFVELTVGQRIGKTTVITMNPPVGPLPQCIFHRGSGEQAASVSSLTFPAGQGLQKALEIVPGGNPVSVGEGGSVMVLKGQARTELAAFKGTTMVIVTLNQESSLEATEIAGKVLDGLP